MANKNKYIGQLVIVRHGESEWNARGVWTGTTDVHLTDKGEEEARGLGTLLADINFDETYVSEQVRTHETANQLLVSARQPVHYRISPALNERDYGVFTGKNKWEVKEQIGAEEFDHLRRGWDRSIPGGETLKMVYERTVPFYKQEVLPLLKKGRSVLIVAHGNSIRSLVKYIESVPSDRVVELNMIFGEALIYKVDDQGKARSKTTRSIHINQPPA